MQKLLLVVGARPNFMKVAPVLRELKKFPDRFQTLLVHTGQHYDPNMSDIFFSDLDMPSPDRFLGVGSGSHAEQTANVMLQMEKIITEENPDIVVVAGDVNSTLATALVAAKASIPLAHIEAGLRSFDREMPEEINRIVADEFSEFCFVTEPSGIQNLKHEGIADSRVHFVGNTMIDSVYRYREQAANRFSVIAPRLGIKKNNYVLVTLHRPSNVDVREPLEQLLKLFKDMSAFAPKIVFPIHPRTRKRLEDFDLLKQAQANERLLLVEPVGYLDFLGLQDHASVILTDSGGIQEESTALNRPCITLRKNTERPITVTEGSNELVGDDMGRVLELTRNAFRGEWKTSSVPKFWDGHAAERIVQVFLAHHSSN